MTATFLLSFCLLQGTYFSNATTYDAATHTLRSGQHILLDEAGRVLAIGLEPIKYPQGAERIVDALVLPHYTDFYMLLQERGLGLDEDISFENQKRMAETLRQQGIDRFRDPLFPQSGVSAAVKPERAFAQRGYVTLQGAQGAGFGMVVDPTAPMTTTLDALPERGPITLWWTTHGADEVLKWQTQIIWVNQFIEALHQQGRKVGAFIEGARNDQLRSLAGLDFDYLEGVPDDTGFLTPANFPNRVWVPLLALNDKRYCAVDLHKRLVPLRKQQLYDEAIIERARAASRQVAAGMADRCKVWRKRRPDVLGVVRAWLAGGGELALGTAGGHPFSFTGELGPEIDLWKEVGISDQRLLKALFTTTPSLLEPVKPYLAVGKPAHFIVYRDGTAGLSVLGKPVDLNYTRGRVLEPIYP